MKKGTILKNLWAGYEAYFIYMGYPVRSGRAEAKKTGGYYIANVNGSWGIERGVFYVQDLANVEMFPPVGHIDLKDIAIAAVLKAISGKPVTNADHIRSMTDEELAWEFMEFRFDAFSKAKGDEAALPDTQRGILDWLKQPYEEDNE